MKGIWITLVVITFVFCVFSYNFRNKYNIDAAEETIETLKSDVAILHYALSIVPEDVRGEVFFNSVKQQFPGVEEREGIVELIKLKVEAEEEPAEANEEGEKMTLEIALDDMISDL